MAMLFIDFCGLLLILIVVTQIILPLFAPNHFDFFWLFRKDKPQTDDEVPTANTGDNLRNEIKVALGLKKKADTAINAARKKTKKNLDEAAELHEKVEDL